MRYYYGQHMTYSGTKHSPFGVENLRDSRAQDIIDRRHTYTKHACGVIRVQMSETQQCEY